MANLKTAYNSLYDRNLQENTLPFFDFLKEENTSNIEALGNYTSPTNFIFNFDDLAPNFTEFWLNKMYLNMIINKPTNQLDVKDYGANSELINGIDFQYSEDGVNVTSVFGDNKLKNFGDFEINNFEKRIAENFKLVGSDITAIQFYQDFTIEFRSLLNFRKGSGGFVRVVLNDDFSNRDLIRHNFKMSGLIFKEI